MPQFIDWTTLGALMLLIAFLTETIIEFVKTQFDKYMSDKAINLIGTALGILLAWLMGATLFITSNVGLEIIGYVVVGLVASRGANYVHNWLDKLPRSK